MLLKAHIKVIEDNSPYDGMLTAMRSAYGDARAATEDAMMVAHANTLLATKAMDADMASQLKQPWHTTGFLRVRYTKEYLALHPEYTGENAHEMPSLKWAKTKQKERDRAMEKWMTDFQSGKIDQEGRPIGVVAETSHQEDSVHTSEHDEEEEHSTDDDNPRPKPRLVTPKTEQRACEHTQARFHARTFATQRTRTLTTVPQRQSRTQ
ncbi:hypothetical protein ACEQ8H_006441 [Pleosporales sp. CAS-2024a]